VIPELPSTYVDHLVSPRHIGDLSVANGAGEIGSMVGGLGVRITISYRDLGGGHAVIDQSAGRAFGSAAALAPLSWLTDVIRNQTAEAALAYTAQDVESALCDGAPANGRLPDRVKQCAEFAIRALHRALGASDAGAPANPNGAGILVCRCLGVGDRTIRCAIRAGARDPEAIGDACNACTGCRSCRSDLLALIDEETSAEPAPQCADRHPVERITLIHGGALLRSLGMPLEAARVNGKSVRISLGPPSEGASTSEFGAVALTRHLLRETVWDGVRVELDTDA